MKMTRLLTSMAIVLALSACTTLKRPTFEDKSGAIRGYDPVAYHTEKMPVKGDPTFSYEYNGSQWLFSSEENRSMFRADPERFAPQYGGYCAYGMSRGHVVSIDPEAWTIKDDKLYLNYSQGVRTTWKKDIPGNIQKADANWLEKNSEQDFE